jgi:hypothetical protein
MQTIESDKIKTVRSSFPNKIASFFNFWTIDILTEWDSIDMIGTMSMYYVKDPDGVVANIELLLSGKDIFKRTDIEQKIIQTTTHKQQTREKVERII